MTPTPSLTLTPSTSAGSDLPVPSSSKMHPTDSSKMHPTDPPTPATQGQALSSSLLSARFHSNGALTGIKEESTLSSQPSDPQTNSNDTAVVSETTTTTTLASTNMNQPKDPLTTLAPFLQQTFQRVTPESFAATIQKEAHPIPLDLDEVETLAGITDALSIEEITQIYAPLCQKLLDQIDAQLFHAEAGHPAAKPTFVIGIIGGVGVGKSTTARAVERMLANALNERFPGENNVQLVSTDNFIKSNAELKAGDILKKKGFPVSYNFDKQVAFLQAVQDPSVAAESVTTPIYSHHTYDILEDDVQTIGHPKVLLLEGLNVMQPLPEPVGDKGFVSDFVDYNIYVHADLDDVKSWYVERFMNFKNSAFEDKNNYWHVYSQLSDEDARDRALRIYTAINEPNLMENIIPTADRADVILLKGSSHHITAVLIRE